MTPWAPRTMGPGDVGGYCWRQDTLVAHQGCITATGEQGMSEHVRCFGVGSLNSRFLLHTGPRGPGSTPSKGLLADLFCRYAQQAQ